MNGVDERRLPRRSASILGWLVLALLALAGPACARKVGDGCTISTDCDPNGNRVCDLSQPGGYCTIDGCDDTSCPDEAVCIRTFPLQYLTKPCDPRCEDSPCTDSQPRVDGTACPCAGAATNDCTVDELCLDSGVCARQAFEHRYCARTCNDNGDCRGGYQCRAAGTRGNFALVSGNNPSAHFCAQNAD